MIDELPIILVVVKYTGTFFKPKKDTVMTGQISLICESHISIIIKLDLLVFGVFSAIIH